ncbi:MAG: methyltransferase [Phycisphaera sp.]|nr:methyltransferase [Phycisphaera sp.]
MHWQILLEHPGLLDAAMAIADFDLAAITRLRKRWDADLVHGAIELTKARRKLADKFGDDAARMVADIVGAEQATSVDVAEHKARRFVEAGVARVVDLCCGIGGDAIGLARIDTITDLALVDMDADKVAMAHHNVAAVARRDGLTINDVAADVESLDLGALVGNGGAFHIDPSRRDDTRRLWRYEDMQPGPDLIERLIAACPDGAIKLGPGVDFDALPPGEVEIINRGGTLVQAVLWTGRLARHTRTATRLPDNVSLHGEPGGAPCDESPRRYLLAVDPAVERADLIGVLSDELDAPALHPALGLLSSDTLIDSPWVTPFELIDEMPWRMNRVKQRLHELDAGIVDVKTRGKAVDADKTAAQLRGNGERHLTVFVLRFGQQVRALITQRL